MPVVRINKKRSSFSKLEKQIWKRWKTKGEICKKLQMKFAAFRMKADERS